MSSTEGFVQEQGALDELSVAKLTLTGIEGVAIDAGTAKIVNLAAPSASTDAARKSEVDAEATARANADTSITNAYIAADTAVTNAYIAADTVVLNDAKSYADSLSAGFTVKAPVKAIATSPITLSGTQTVDGVALVAGDRVLVTAQADAATNGIYVVAAGAWARSADANADAEVKDGMSVFVEQGTSNADSTWVLVTNNVIVLGTTALTFQQFSGLGQITAGSGLTKSGNTLNVGSGDGIAVAADSVAVDLASNPGLQFTGGKLDAKPNTAKALAKDADGLYVKADSAKALAIDGTNGLQVKADSAKALAIDGTNGLQVKADTAKALAIDGTNGLQVKADGWYGLQIDDTAGLRLMLASGKGLAFSSGFLGVKLETDAGMEFDGTNGGLELKLVSADRLSKSSSGLDVVGLPSQFKINGSAVQTSVNATNLNALTSFGLDASVDHLHSHSMVALNGLYAAEELTAGKFVYISSYTNGQSLVSVASCSAAASSRVVGMSVQFAGATGSKAYVMASGCIPGAIFAGLTTGSPYYLGPTGSPVLYSALQSGDRVIRVGFASSPTDLIVDIQDMGQKA